MTDGEESESDLSSKPAAPGYTTEIVLGTTLKAEAINHTPKSNQELQGLAANLVLF